MMTGYEDCAGSVLKKYDFVGYVQYDRLYRGFVHSFTPKKVRVIPVYNMRSTLPKIVIDRATAKDFVTIRPDRLIKAVKPGHYR